MSPVKEYKCLNCGAGLEFDPPSYQWICGYCFSAFEKEQLDCVLTEEPPEQAWPELDSFHCRSCGAELITDGTTSATSCLYCKSPAVIKARLSGSFRPSSLIPFRLTKAQAEDIYRKWIGKRLFAPNEFKSREEIKRVTGVYAPFWLFDCLADGTLVGEGTVVDSWRQGDYKITRTKHYEVVRKGKAQYRQIPVDASKKLDDTLMHKIEPYNYSDLTGFSMQYMSGFMAEKYDVPADEAEQIMRKRVEKYTEDRLRAAVKGYTSYRATDKKITLSEKSHSYSLLPVYLLINKYRDKEYIFMVNGQTGKVVGDVPVSTVKQLAFAGSVFAAVWLLAVFGGALLV